MRFFGCTHDEAVTLNDGFPLRQPLTKAARYISQRNAANLRGVGWEITFAEWLAVWAESGKWELRGVGANAYCMARHGDTGPYKVGNVSIQTGESNSRDGVKKTHITLRERGSWGGGTPLGSGRGWTYRPKGGAKPYQVIAANRYVGVFATQDEAEAAYASAVSEIRSAHSSAICQFEPLNTTQQISEAL